MTVGELRAALAAYDDNAEVCLIHQDRDGFDTLEPAEPEVVPCRIVDDGWGAVVLVGDFGLRPGVLIRERR